MYGVIQREWALFVCLVILCCVIPQSSWPQNADEEPSAAADETAEEAQPKETSKSSGAANLINENQLLGLPLNGRSYSQLATLEAGVSDSSASSASRGVGGGSLSVSGSRNTSNHFLLDGTSIMNSLNQLPKSAAGVQLGSDTVLDRKSVV